MSDFYRAFKSIHQPKEWSISKLVDACDLITCGVAARPNYVDSDGIPFLSSLNVKQGKIIWKGYQQISKEDHDELIKNNKPIKGDILYTRVGSFGEAAIVERDVDFSVFVSLTLIKPKLTVTDNFYLKHILNSSEVKALANNTTTGLGVQNLNVSEVRRFELPFPPLPEQQKIAAILTSVDEVIENTQAQINKLKDLKTGMMQELLTRGVGVDGKPHTEFKDSPVGRIPKGWEVVTLGDVTLESAFGPRFSSDEYAVDGNIGCIRTTDMDENWDINYSTAPLARLNFKEFEKHILVDGDLLVTRSGTCGLVDVFRKQSIPMVAAAFLIRFRLDETVNPFFVRYLMMSTDIQENVQMLASGGVQKNLSGTNLKTLKIPRPSIKEQNQIVKVIESINRRISVANRRLASDTKLKKALMQDLLTGKVRVKVDD